VLKPPATAQSKSVKSSSNLISNLASIAEPQSRLRIFVSAARIAPFRAPAFTQKPQSTPTPRERDEVIVFAVEKLPRPSLRVSTPK